MISIVSDEGPFVEKGQIISKKKKKIDNFPTFSKKKYPLRFQCVPNMKLVGKQIND